MVLQNCLALDMVLLQLGVLCAYINKPVCCLYHDESQGLILDHDDLAKLVRKNQVSPYLPSKLDS